MQKLPSPWHTTPPQPCCAPMTGGKPEIRKVGKDKASRYLPLGAMKSTRVAARSWESHLEALDLSVARMQSRGPLPALRSVSGLNPQAIKARCWAGPYGPVLQLPLWQWLPQIFEAL